MSFSSDIKEELSKITNLSNKQALLLEFIGYMLSNNITIQNNKIRYATENKYNINRFNKILTNMSIDYEIKLKGKSYIIIFRNQDIDFLEYTDKKVQVQKDKFNDTNLINNENNIKAMIRGCFMGGGSLNNPDNKYHLEIFFSNKENAEFIKSILEQFSINVKVLKRQNSFSIYIKEAEEISKFLALIGANKSVLNFEEIRVVRDTRNNVNRLVNCETANLNKIVNAAVEQITAINLLKEKNKFDELEDSLKEISNLRLENPDASLIELGKMLKQPLGKSGVNHRLKKIVKIAGEI